MFSRILFCVFVQTLFTSANTKSFEEYDKELEVQMVLAINNISDYIEYVPEKIVKVQYGSMCINPGDTVLVLDTILPPLISFENNNCDNYTRHTVIMVDLDAAGTTEDLGYLHWHCIVKCDFQCDENNTKQYLPPVSGHRFLFVLFKKLLYDPQNVGYISRFNFSINDFAEKFNYGHAVAINLMIINSK